MASRISQMRNGMQLPPQTPLYQQEQLKQSVEQVRGMMQQIKNAQNPQATLAQILQNNPNTAAIATMLKSTGNLETMAKQMAQMRGIDINQLIQDLLQGGI